MLEKYIDKLIKNKDYIEGSVMTDKIPYDNRYFVIELLKEIDKEYSEKYSRLFKEMEELEEYKFMYEELCK